MGSKTKSRYANLDVPTTALIARVKIKKVEIVNPIKTVLKEYTLLDGRSIK